MKDLDEIGIIQYMSSRDILIAFRETGLEFAYIECEDEEDTERLYQRLKNSRLAARKRFEDPLLDIRERSKYDFRGLRVKKDLELCRVILMNTREFTRETFKNFLRI